MNVCLYSFLSYPECKVHEPYYTVSTDKYLARPTARCILFDGENISFDASLVIYTYTYINININIYIYIYKGVP